jgi:trypsin
VLTTVIRRHDRPDSDVLVDEADWPAVVTFFEGDGAGTLVAPKWILTAAHTAANIPPDHRLPVGGSTARVARVVGHLGEGVDLALVELQEAVASVAPIALYAEAGEQGQEVVLLGRGDFGTGREGVQGQDQRLRRVTNRIDDVDERWLRFRFDAPPAGTHLEGVGGEGDSGGPALIEHDGGVRIAGVSSWQDHDGPLSTYGCVEYYARVSTQAEWIRTTIAS